MLQPASVVPLTPLGSAGRYIMNVSGTETSRRWDRPFNSRDTFCRFTAFCRWDTVMKRKLIPTIWVLTLVCASGWAFQDNDQLRQEEIENYYKKWLEEDVLYIISDEERAVFNELTTDEEKEQFIEQFWFRRDPDARTSENEFKAEHYRRIAYANEKFTSGDRGWMTDRGRTYIIHGPPAQIESRPTGGLYMRPIEEGGGQTSVYP